MDENKQPQYFSPVQPPVVPQKAPAFPSGKKDLTFGLLILVFGWLLCNSVFYAGLNLGFAIFSGCSILLSVGYLMSKGRKLEVYPGILFALSLVVCASFARGDDGFVKFILLCFLIISVNLGICLMCKQNLRSANGVSSLLDFFRCAFSLALGHLSPAFRGFFRSLRGCGRAGRKGGAIALGLLIALPLLLLVCSLLISADAAFDALLKKLPDWELGEILCSLIFGTLLAGYFYARASTAHHFPRKEVAPKTKKGLNPLTVNTVLVAISAVYAVYLFSQLAYFSGGFSGILPENYTVAQYARRGFFEMAWLCAINLLIISLAMGLVSGSTPKFTRFVCLFLGLMTVFLAATASAKMFMYIGSFGLTRLRVLTQVIIFWLGLTTIGVCVWIFVPKLPYMKLVLILALCMGTIVAWADVDTVVARYNVNAYQSGQLETVDVYYLDRLGSGAIPYIAQLQEDADPEVAKAAQEALSTNWHSGDDFRDWNYARHIAEMYDAD